MDATYAGSGGAPSPHWSTTRFGSSSTWGQTIGKSTIGIEVRPLDGAERLSFGQASIRNLLRLIDVFVIGEVMVAAGKRQQRLGDKAAKTVVVRRAPSTKRVAPGGAPSHKEETA
jgi:uncharacterized RDD family membrane protein YckC